MACLVKVLQQCYKQFSVLNQIKHIAWNINELHKVMGYHYHYHYHYKTMCMKDVTDCNTINLLDSNTFHLVRFDCPHINIITISECIRVLDIYIYDSMGWGRCLIGPIYMYLYIITYKNANFIIKYLSYQKIDMCNTFFLIGDLRSDPCGQHPYKLYIFIQTFDDLWTSP